MVDHPSLLRPASGTAFVGLVWRVGPSCTVPFVMLSTFVGFAGFVITTQQSPVQIAIYKPII